MPNKPQIIAFSGLQKSGKTVLLTNLLNYFHAAKNTGFVITDPGCEFTWDNRVPHGIQQQNKTKIEDIKIGGNSLEIFPYDEHIKTLKSGKWPNATDKVYQYPATFKVMDQSGKSEGMITDHEIILVDFPGEFLCDVPMIDLSFDQWSKESLDRLSEEPYNRYFNDFILLEKSENKREVKQAAFDKAFLAAEKDHIYYLNPVIGAKDLKKDTEKSFFPSLNLNDSFKATLESNYNDYVAKYVKPFVTLLDRCDKHILLFNVLAFTEFDQEKNTHRFFDHEMITKNILSSLFKRLKFGEETWRKLRTGNIKSITAPVTECAHRIFSKVLWKRPQIHFVCTKADHFKPIHREHLRNYLNECLNREIKDLNFNLGNVQVGPVCSAINCSIFEENNQKTFVRAEDPEYGPIEYPFDPAPPKSISDLIKYEYYLGLPPAKIKTILGLLPQYNLGEIAKLLFS